jgi:hypothetical protein
LQLRTAIILDISEAYTVFAFHHSSYADQPKHTFAYLNTHRTEKVQMNSSPIDEISQVVSLRKRSGLVVRLSKENSKLISSIAKEEIYSSSKLFSKYL